MLSKFFSGVIWRTNRDPDGEVRSLSFVVWIFENDPECTTEYTMDKVD